MKYKWNTVMELIILMFNTSSNFDNNDDNDTPHDNAEDSELMSPQTPSTAQDQVSKIDTNASKIHSHSTFAEFENLRCSGLHKLHKFASGNNNVIYCVHCDTLLEDSIYIITVIINYIQNIMHVKERNVIIISVKIVIKIFQMDYVIHVMLLNKIESI